MHLLVWIPAYNEEQTVGSVVSAIPKDLPGITRCTVVVVDDGSRDRTAEFARLAGAEVIAHPWRQGLAEAFRTGLRRAQELDPDILVTIDSDAQYDSREICAVIAPVLSGDAEVVVGDRRVMYCTHMPMGNRLGNVLGSTLLRILTGIPACDASSGFRALSKAAFTRMEIFSLHTYTHEMLLRALALRMRMQSTPVSFRKRAYGESKLVRTLSRHFVRSIGTIVRCMLTIDPLRTFFRLGFLTLLFGLSLFLFAFLLLGGTLEWLKLTAILLIFLSIQLCILGILAEALRTRSIHPGKSSS